MRLPNLAPGDRRALLIGLVVAAPMAIWMLVATPYLHAVQETRSRLEASRDLLARERRLLAGAKRYPVVLAEGKTRLAAVAGRLFEGDNESVASAGLATHLRQHARASRVLISELKSAPAERAGNGLTAVSLHVTGESDLEGLLTFLRSLEAGAKLVHVDQLEIESAQPAAAPGPTPGASAGGAEVLSFQLTVKGFALTASGR
ncbi:MAG: type II secretion system protein GspM [Gemmatimonadaceae bacterium]